MHVLKHNFKNVCLVCIFKIYFKKHVLNTIVPEAMYTESAFRREELEGSGGEKQPEEEMESAEILRNICEKDVTLFRTAHSKDLNSVSWALRTLVEREPETFFLYL